VAGGHAPQNGWPCKLVQSTGFPYRNRTFILTVLYGFGLYRTVTVPYIRSENGDTAYKHNTVDNGQPATATQTTDPNNRPFLCLYLLAFPSSFDNFLPSHKIMQGSHQSTPWD
jgi:hypothetical protein